MAIHAFIDTNIFLDFFRLGHSDILKLKRLPQLLDDEIVLYLPQQVRDEYFKNRLAVIKNSENSDGLKALLNKDNCIPQHWRQSELYADIEDLREKLKSRMKTLQSEINEKRQTYTLEVDILIEEIFSKAKIIESDKYFLEAHKQFLLGKVPGKKNDKLGDALNWVSLQNEIPKKIEFHFVSGDNDFRNPIDSLNPHDFFATQWTEKTGGTIKLFKNLNDFLEGVTTIQLDGGKRTLIQELQNAATFRETHGIVYELLKRTPFTNDEKAGIKAALRNNQVNLIIMDDDIQELYQCVLDTNDWREIIKESGIQNNLPEKVIESQIEFHSEIGFE